MGTRLGSHALCVRASRKIRSRELLEILVDCVAACVCVIVPASVLFYHSLRCWRSAKRLDTNEQGGKKEHRKGIAAHSISVAQLPPNSAGVHHPQISVRRPDYLERHPEVTPLSPAVAPTVLDKRQLFRKVVAEAEDLVA